MNWTVDYSKKALKFFGKKQENKQIVENELKKLIRAYNGETVSINIIGLKGEWGGYHRIRKGDIRIVIIIDESNKNIKVYDVDFRGSIYSEIIQTVHQPATTQFRNNCSRGRRCLQCPATLNFGKLRVEAN